MLHHRRQIYLEGLSPVLVGSIVGNSVDLDSSVFNLLSESISFTVLLGSFSVGFSTSPSCASVFITVSLPCSSGVLACSLSVCDVGASRTTIY